MPKQETKNSKRILRVILTKEELLEAGKNQADKAMQLIALENDRKRIADDLKAKITALEASLQVLAATITSGYEMREVKCHEVLDEPEPGKKLVYRDDTGERVAVEAMSQAEMQRELIND